MKRRTNKYKGVDNTLSARRAYTRHDGDISPDQIDNDIPLEHLQELKMGFYSTKVIVTTQEACKIERSTTNQADNETWLLERRKRITASKVGMITKMRSTIKGSKKVEQLLYSKFRG